MCFQRLHKTLHQCSIKYDGKGDIHTKCTNDEHMIFLNVSFMPNLKTKILSLGKLDDQGCKTTLQDGFLTIHDKKGRLPTKTLETRGNMYFMQFNIF